MGIRIVSTGIGVAARVALLVMVALLAGCASLPRGAAPVAAPPFSESRWTTVAGGAWHWRMSASTQAGAGERCVVVLVHGFAGSTWSWREVLPRLAASGHDAIAIDLPGFGYSTRTLPASGEVAGLRELLDAGPAAGRPLCLVGHSMGAAVVASLAAEQPARVPLLVLVDGLPASAMPRAGGGALALRPLRALAAGIAQCCVITRGRIERLLADAYGRPPTSAEVDGYLAPLRLPGTARAILDRSVLARAASAELPASLPVVMVWGRQDRWIRLARAEAWQARHPWVELVVLADAGHNPMETHVDAFMSVLLERLGKKGAPAP
jgi:pimeloyl-ACP methyl ester carboxylesterase